jgi:hypothetical protein
VCAEALRASYTQVILRVNSTQRQLGVDARPMLVDVRRDRLG